jgi:uncharacterized MAPEG superfamily protein
MRAAEETDVNEIATAYGPALLAFGVFGAAFLLQVLVADLAGISTGHVPGTSLKEESHDQFVFRATRALANTNETVAAFVVLALLGMLAGASPAWVNGLTWTYVLARVGHMAAYYADLRPVRSVFFGIAVMALIGLLVVGFVAAA